jgi:two-component system, OmpR family, response regulator
MKRPLRSVLAVDDDADILAVVSLVLRSLGGLEVQTASGGVDLVLLDVMMPGMDGPETLAAMRREPATAHTPVVLMTARVQLYEQASPPATVLAVIAKPFDPVSLATRLQALWAKAPEPAE